MAMRLVMNMVSCFLLGSFIHIYLARPDNRRGGSSKTVSFGERGVSPPSWPDQLRMARGGGRRGTWVSAMQKPAPASPGPSFPLLPTSPSNPTPRSPPSRHPWPKPLDQDDQDPAVFWSKFLGPDDLAPHGPNP